MLPRFGVGFIPKIKDADKTPRAPLIEGSRKGHLAAQSCADSVPLGRGRKVGHLWIDGAIDTNGVDLSNTAMKSIFKRRMLPVLVATSSGDLTAEVISAAVARCEDMRLMGDRVILFPEIDGLLALLPHRSACALFLVGSAADTEQMERCWLSKFKRLVVLRIDFVDDLVRIAARQVGMRGLIGAIRSLVRDDESANGCAARSASSTGGTHD